MRVCNTNRRSARIAAALCAVACALCLVVFTGCGKVDPPPANGGPGAANTANTASNSNKNAATNNAAGFKGDAAKAKAQEEAAVKFLTAWKNGWNFEGGKMITLSNQSDFTDKYMKLVASGSDAAKWLPMAAKYFPASDKDKGIPEAYLWSWGAGTHVVDAQVVSHEGDTVVVDLATYATQNSVNDQLWNSLVSKGASHQKFAVTLNSDSQVTALALAGGGASTPSSSSNGDKSSASDSVPAVFSDVVSDYKKAASFLKRGGSVAAISHEIKYVAHLRMSGFTAADVKYCVVKLDGLGDVMLVTENASENKIAGIYACKEGFSSIEYYLPHFRETLYMTSDDAFVISGIGPLAGDGPNASASVVKLTGFGGSETLGIMGEAGSSRFAVKTLASVSYNSATGKGEYNVEGGKTVSGDGVLAQFEKDYPKKSLTWRSML